MRDNWDLVLILGGVLVLIFSLIGLIFVSSQNFVDRCERAGGVSIKYEVCVPKGTQILIVS